MARTKASVGAKVSSGKSSKARAVCAPVPPASPATGGGGGTNRSSYSGGNSVCPRETPSWQKPITRFFPQAEENGNEASNEEVAAGSSKEDAIRAKRKSRNVIMSDDEEEATEPATPTSAPKVTHVDLDNSSPELPPLDGEDSHKIAEYFPKVNCVNSPIKVKVPTSKNKGKGSKKSNKKADDKENEESGLTEEGKNAVKRMASDGESGDETLNSNKRVKVQN